SFRPDCHCETMTATRSHARQRRPGSTRINREELFPMNNENVPGNETPAGSQNPLSPSEPPQGGTPAPGSQPTPPPPTYAAPPAAPQAPAYTAPPAPQAPAYQPAQGQKTNILAILSLIFAFVFS